MPPGLAAPRRSWYRPYAHRYRAPGPSSLRGWREFVCSGSGQTRLEPLRKNWCRRYQVCQAGVHYDSTVSYRIRMDGCYGRPQEYPRHGAPDLSGLLLANCGAHLRGFTQARRASCAQAVRHWSARSRRSARALPRGLSPCAPPAPRRTTCRTDCDSEQLPLLLRHCDTQQIPGIPRLRRGNERN